MNATVVRGGDKTNVIPSRIDLEIDGRPLLGFTPAEFGADTLYRLLQRYGRI